MRFALRSLRHEIPIPAQSLLKDCSLHGVYNCKNLQGNGKPANKARWTGSIGQKEALIVWAAEPVPLCTIRMIRHEGRSGQAELAEVYGTPTISQPPMSPGPK